MPDVKPENISASTVSGEGTSPTGSQPSEQTTPTPQVIPPTSAQAPVSPVKPETAQVEKTIPYSRFQEVNNQLKEMRRKAAQEQASKGLQGYDPNDLETVRNHPYVQELELSKARTELRTGAEDILQRYPNVPPSIRKAIIKNPRGYVNENTADVPTALLDIEDYIQEIASEFETPATAPKQFPIAGTNTPSNIQGSANPAEVQAILKKPVDEWTPAEVEILHRYQVPTR
jgi:hypothetical protein